MYQIMAAPRQTANHANTECAFRWPGTYVDGFEGCRTNQRPPEAWGLDISERSLPHVRQYWTQAGFWWPDTHIRRSNEPPHNQQYSNSLWDSLPQILHFFFRSNR
jgi:hypothetical protein